MAELMIRGSDANSGRYKGRSWDSIARRVWGRKAYVKQGEPISVGMWSGYVVKADKTYGGSRVLAEVILYS